MSDQDYEAYRVLREALMRRKPRTIPDVKNESEEADQKAFNEAAAIASGDLETEAAKNEHVRTQRFRDHFAGGMITVFWIILVCIIVMGLIWFWHLITPNVWHFLTPPQTEKIGTLLFGGAISAFVAKYAEKRIG
jgi:hypothetical protein